MKVHKVSPDYVKQLIAEEKQVLLEHQRYKSMIITEAYRMKADGLSQEQINEGLMDIIKSLGGGFIETFKYDLTLALLGKLGLSKEGFLARAIANVVENADIMEFKKYFSPGGCTELTDLIMDSLAETGVEPLVDGFMKGLGIDPGGRIYATMREALAKQLLDGELAQWIEDAISNWICGIDVSAIVDVFKGGLDAASSAGGGLMDKVKGMFGFGDDAAGAAGAGAGAAGAAAT
jgi:hypothetical protein